MNVFTTSMCKTTERTLVPSKQVLSFDPHFQEEHWQVWTLEGMLNIQ
jgi:hypothetical protein